MTEPSKTDLGTLEKPQSENNWPFATTNNEKLTKLANFDYGYGTKLRCYPTRVSCPEYWYLCDER